MSEHLKTKKKMKKWKKWLIGIVLLLLFYEVGGALIPFIGIKETGTSFQEQFQPETFYGTENSVDRAAIVETSMEALTSRLQMIRQAKEKIILSTFDIREGNSTDDVFAEIWEAADRGVKVQVLVDGLYGSLHMNGKPMFYALGNHPNIEIRFYNVFDPFRPWTANGRMHDKYVLIDDALLLLGGRNTFDYFLGEYDMEDLSYDRDVLIYNTAAGTDQNKESVIAQVDDYFQDMWRSQYCKTVFENTPGWMNQEIEEAGEDLEKHFQQMTRSGMTKDLTWEDYAQQTVAIKKATLIHNPTDIWAKEPWIWYQLQYLMEHAKERVYIHTPYAVLSQDMYEGMAAVDEQVPEFTMLLNAVAVGDNVMASSDYLHNRDEILDTGVTLFEFYGERSSHGKSLFIDDDISVIGSYNLDMRSTYLDTEVMLVIHGEEFNQLLEQKIMDMQGQALEVKEDESYVPDKKVEQREIPEQKKRMFFVMPWLVQPFRNLI